MLGKNKSSASDMEARVKVGTILGMALFLREISRRLRLSGSTVRSTATAPARRS